MQPLLISLLICGPLIAIGVAVYLWRKRVDKQRVAVRTQEPIELLRERASEAERKKRRWGSFCAGSWIVVGVMLIVCLAAWGVPFGVLGFLYLCMFVMPVVAVASIAYYVSKQNWRKA